MERTSVQPSPKPLCTGGGGSRGAHGKGDDGRVVVTKFRLSGKKGDENQSKINQARSKCRLGRNIQGGGKGEGG